MQKHTWEKLRISAGQSVWQSISMIQGINREISKDIIKIIKDSKLRFKSQYKEMN